MESKKKREYGPDDYVLCFPDSEKYIVVNDSCSRFYPGTGEYSFKSTDGLKITIPYDKFRDWKYEKAQEYEKEIRNKVNQVDSVSILGTHTKSSGKNLEMRISMVKQITHRIKSEFGRITSISLEISMS